MSLEILQTLVVWFALCAYTVVTGLFIAAWARKQSGLVAIAAALLTTLYLLSYALVGLNFATLALETLALFAWIGFLARLLGVRRSRAPSPALRTASITLGAAAFFSLYSILASWRLAVHGEADADAWSTRYILQILINVTGLLFVEQLMRNVKAEDRWRIRYLGIGLGSLFLFQIALNATALHGGDYNLTLLTLEPAILGLVAPCLIVALRRNRSAPMELSLSRQMIFRVGTLFATGLALLALGAFGFLLTAFDGDWRLAFVALLTMASAIAVAIVLGSSRMRARSRQLIAEHLFRQKYDYRNEWLRVTRELTEPSPDYDLPQQVIRALSQVVMAEGGAIWVTTAGGPLVPLGRLNVEWQTPLSHDTAVSLASAFDANEQPLDIRSARSRVGAAALEELATLPDLRYVIPLMSESRLVGIVGLRSPPAPNALGWEDHDILRLIAREAAGIVALQAAERALSEAERLHGFHQLSAFVLHDVKTIAAQLSLLLQNAERHKSNPAFIEEMLKTLANAVQRVNRLLEQLRQQQSTERVRVDLGELLERTIQPLRLRHPVPTLHIPKKPVLVSAEAQALASAISHLVQNAIDAAAARTDIPEPERQVRITLTQESPWAAVHIEDTGFGMERDFIENHLFAPLASTKGVTGMGLGAYQARTHMRAMGGDITVTSKPGTGSHFILRLPLEPGHA